MHSRVRGRLFGAGIVASALVASIPMGTAAQVDAAVTVPGVTSQSITVGALVTQSGFLAADFTPVLDGVRAYFSQVNAKGGVNGRTIDLKYPLDDASNPFSDSALLHTLVEQDHVFAIVGVASGFFNAPYLAGTKTPTFGFATTGGWSPAPNLFAAYGSYSDALASLPAIEYAVKKNGGTKVGLVAYNQASSSGECSTLADQFPKQYLAVAVKDLSIAYGTTNLTSDATRMKNAGVDAVVSCLDVNGNLAFERALASAGLSSAPSLWLDGYDRNLLTRYPDLYANVTLMLQHVPFEAATEFPNAYPGLNAYLAQMLATAPSSTYAETALEGWLSAALFVAGLQKVGPTFTQASLVKAINGITNFTGGVTTPVDWRSAHKKTIPPGCSAFVRASGTHFQLAFNTGKNPWVCFPAGTTVNLAKPVLPPKGTPGL